MPIDLDPVVGNWYEHLDKGQKFEVVAVDEESGVVEIQHFDGDLEEIDLEGWYELDIESIEAPEDWSGPVDDVEPDDLGYSETDMEEEDWSESFQEVKPVEAGAAGEEEGEESVDEWGEGRMPEERWEGDL